MNIEFEVQLSDEEQEQLSEIIGCDVDDLSDTLSSYCSAAAEEYVRMFLGQRVFTRGADFREYRLFLLIKHVFDNRIPGEQTISDLFQTTATRSRSLSKSVMSKYQYELSAAIDKTLEDTLAQADQKEEGGHYLVTIENKNIVSSINQVLASIDGGLPQMSKKRGSVSTYKLQPSSYKKLLSHFEID
jgi:hypothetical protein